MKIKILHLPDGIHFFEHQFSGGELKNINQEVYPYDIFVRVEFNKFEKNISSSITVNTLTHFLCDRCLNHINRNMEINFHVLFHYNGDNLSSEEENVVLISRDQQEIDLTPFIEEYLVLSIPMKVVCAEDCKGICPGCGADLNKEACKCTKKVHDPRWQKLYDLLENKAKKNTQEIKLYGKSTKKDIKIEKR